MSEAFLQVDDLHVTYVAGDRRVPAVQGVSFTLPKGGSLGLAGESGCGKSTLANAILRLLPAGTDVTGSVRLADQDVLSLNPGRMRAVRWVTGAIVFQGALHALNPVQRVGRQIAEPMLVHETEPSEKAALKRSSDLLEQVGLAGTRIENYPHELSGGQRQRVLIAMALACDPELLIADEPTTALDLMVQAQVLALLSDLRSERGLSMMFITHDLSVLSSTCDDLAVMYAGRIVESGPAAEVFTHAIHPYTRALAAAFPTIGDESSRMHPSGLGGDPPDPAALPSGCPFHPRCTEAIDRCSVEHVELADITPGRRAACLLARAP